MSEPVNVRWMTEICSDGVDEDVEDWDTTKDGALRLAEGQIARGCDASRVRVYEVRLIFEDGQVVPGGRGTLTEQAIRHMADMHKMTCEAHLTVIRQQAKVIEELRRGGT